ncbi:MAG TPA: YqgQ family protein [Candidatus Salinicoccus stercoripullorum]|uniref:YqgQ family protein n=1 Tax=Candidatus Salinicoccus stercoripullorum TaxID=2838756 RepID=A0A9D1TZB2_9STAP|nr:YqgQ family protein [Candidatus Salinicoccus stercoripullorum]
MNNKDLSDINLLLRRYGIYVYDRDEKNKLAMMEMEIKELYKHGLVTSEEFTEALLILRKRG